MKIQITKHETGYGLYIDGCYERFFQDLQTLMKFINYKIKEEFQKNVNNI